MKCCYTFLFLMLFLSVSTFAQSPCSDLFISEYIEGTSNNKVIELFNPTGNNISLNNYKVSVFSNGSKNGNAIVLSGSIPSKGTYIIANTKADSVILVIADTVSGSLSFNGNDAVALINTSANDTIDIIGVIGNDPGKSWAVDTGSTVDHSLVRRPAIHSGQTDWVTGAGEWEVYSVNDFTHLGTHTMDPCPLIPALNFTSIADTVDEDAGRVVVKISITNPDTIATSIGIVLAAASTATNGDDFIFTDTTITFPANSSDTLAVSVEIIDDGISEPIESIVLQLSNPSSNAVLGTVTSYTLFIRDNDPTAVMDKEQKSESVKLFPNPAKDYCMIWMREGVTKLTVVNRIGVTVTERQVAGEKTFLLNIKELSYGFYFINLYSDSGVVTRKLIRQ